MTKDNKLEHIAIIMDGNGRWATRRGLPRFMGHKKGAEVVKTITRAAADEGVKFLTLYAFSTENWQRGEEEVSYLMNLLRQYLKNPKGFAFWRVVKMQHPESFKRLVMDCIHYCSSSQISGNRNYIKESPRKLLTVLCTPAGWMLTGYIRRKA